MLSATKTIAVARASGMPKKEYVLSKVASVFNQFNLLSNSHLQHTYLNEKCRSKYRLRATGSPPLVVTDGRVPPLKSNSR